ncbi:MAG: transcriptional regulator [Pedobacter sp.]|nr:MAG: transcriptional regulator [Pedobacter sp.]
MREQTRKYLKDAADDYPDIGNFVHWFIKQGGHKKKEVADYLEVLPTTLTRYFGQRSLQVGILWRISQAINYNLVMDLGQRLKIPFETEVEKELRKQLAEKEEVIKRMEIQLEVFKGLGERR